MAYFDGFGLDVETVAAIQTTYFNDVSPGSRCDSARGFGIFVTPESLHMYMRTKWQRLEDNACIVGLTSVYSKIRERGS